MSDTEKTPEIEAEAETEAKAPVATLKGISGGKKEYTKAELKKKDSIAEDMGSFTRRSILEAAIAGALARSMANRVSFDRCVDYVHSKHYTCREMECFLDTSCEQITEPEKL